MSGQDLRKQLPLFCNDPLLILHRKVSCLLRQPGNLRIFKKEFIKPGELG